MQKLSLLILIILFSTINTSGIALAGEDRVVAKYNGKEIKKSEITERLKVMLHGKLPEDKKDFDDISKDLKARIIQDYVNNKVLSEAAKESQVHNSDIYKKQLEELNNQMAVNLYLDHYAKRNITDATLKTEYNNMVKSLKESDDKRVSHILVASEQDATKILDEIKSGKISFEDAAKKYSVDPTTKDRGGEIGFISKGQTVPAFEKTTYSLKQGEISKPIKTDFGWHIIKLLESKKKAIPSFDEIKENLEQSVGMRLKQEHVKQLLGKVKTEIIADKK